MDDDDRNKVGNSRWIRRQKESEGKCCSQESGLGESIFRKGSEKTHTRHSNWPGLLLAKLPFLALRAGIPRSRRVKTILGRGSHPPPYSKTLASLCMLNIKTPLMPS